MTRGTLSLYKDLETVRQTGSLLNTEEPRLRSDFEAFCLSGRPTGGSYEVLPTGDPPQRQWILVRFDAVTRIEITEASSEEP